MESKLDLVRLAKVLDEVGDPGRMATIATWDKRIQALLFEAAKGFRPVGLDHFVPTSVPARTEVLHDGRNTLPLFATLQKRFAKPDDYESDPRLFGYNHQSMIGFTGPGYFTARPGDPGEVIFDYRSLPDAGTPKPSSWPDIVSNHARLGRFVFEGLTDQVRALSNHVIVGRASRNGQLLDEWFTMVRKDPR
ncbi:MAG: hypothetical protein U0169_14435 [Polyangiaceae bacterium]